MKGDFIAKVKVGGELKPGRNSTIEGRRPYHISVDYFWEREAEIGGGATKWFFCFFGKVVEIGETNEFVT